MPYMVKVLGVRLDVEKADPTDAERAERWLKRLFEDDLAAGDLAADLETVARDASSARAWVLVEGEERELSMHVVGGERRTLMAVRVAQGLVVEGRRDLDAIANELAHQSFVKTGRPKAPRASDERKRFAKKREEALAAIAARDVAQMVACLRAPELSGSRGLDVRAELVRALVARPLSKHATPEVARDAGEALFAALRDDGRTVAHAVSSQLFRQTELAGRLLDELTSALGDSPRSNVFVARLANAVAQWPDFSLPEAFLASLRPDVRAIIDFRFAEAQPKRKLSETLGAAVEALERGNLGGFRRARVKTISAKLTARENMRATFGRRLATIAGEATGDPTVRGAALDLLRALDVPRSELGALVSGLPGVSGVRELALAASQLELPPATLTPSSPPEGPAIGGDQVLRAARHRDGFLVANRRGALALEIDGVAKWRVDGLKNPVPLRVLGDSPAAAFAASQEGLHAFDQETGRELWFLGAIDVPTELSLGVVTDPRPTVWTLDERILVLGSDHLTWIDAKNGRIEAVVGLPFTSPHGLAPLADDAVVVLDGTHTMSSFFNADFVLSGLVVRRDGSTEDRVVPATLGSVQREVDGARLDFSQSDVVVERGGETRRWALPEGVTRIGPVVREPENPARVLVFVAIHSGSFEDGQWFSLHV